MPLHNMYKNSTVDGLLRRGFTRSVTADVLDEDESFSKPSTSAKVLPRAVTFDAEVASQVTETQFTETELKVYRQREGQEEAKKAQRLIRSGTRTSEEEKGKTIARAKSTVSDESDEPDARRQRKHADGPAEARSTAFVDSERFTCIMGAIVFMNVITIGVEADYDDLAPALFNNVNVGFLLAYFTELCGRFLAHGTDELRDRVTIMDVTIFFVTIIGRLVWQEQRGFVSALPSFRLLRVVRLLGMSKELKDQKELVALTEGAYGHMMTLLWMILLLFLMMLAIATFAYKVVGESAEWNETRDPLEDYEAFEAFDNREYFGSLSRSVLSLLQVTTLSHWADAIARPIVEVYPATFAFFTCFLFATSYGLVLCVVSNVVIRSMTSSKGLEDAKHRSARQDREALAERAWQVFARVDKDGDGFLTASEFAECMEDPLLIDLFQRLEAPILEDPEEMVRLFDHENAGTVTYYKLVRGLLSFGDPLNEKDWMRCSIRVYSLLRRAQKMEERLEDMLDQISYARKMIAGAIRSMNQVVDMLAEKRVRTEIFERMRSGPEAASPLVLVGAEDRRGTRPPPAQGSGLLTFAQRFVGFVPSPKSLTGATPLASSAASSPKSVLQLTPPGSPLRQAATPGTVAEEPPSPLPPAAAAATTVAAVVCGRARLGEPPGRFEAERDRARREQRRAEDPYGVTIGADGAASKPARHLPLWSGGLPKAGTTWPLVSSAKVDASSQPLAVALKVSPEPPRRGQRAQSNRRGAALAAACAGDSCCPALLAPRQAYRRRLCQRGRPPRSFRRPAAEGRLAAHGGPPRAGPRRRGRGGQHRVLRGAPRLRNPRALSCERGRDPTPVPELHDRAGVDSAACNDSAAAGNVVYSAAGDAAGGPDDGDADDVAVAVATDDWRLVDAGHTSHSVPSTWDIYEAIDGVVKWGNGWRSANFSGPGAWLQVSFAEKTAVQCVRLYQESTDNGGFEYVVSEVALQGLDESLGDWREASSWRAGTEDMGSRFQLLPGWRWILAARTRG
ncbi:unnamed protein product [Prorocentrum cordatum]|uniref:EF-hand domain-containing protein n=1 Tax=Prorocentrum cordatum TaxID=2364126 RepID=A0ABN9VUD0_9DINO|nr:unnamed protein product [Polarella glacialis]